MPISGLYYPGLIKHKLNEQSKQCHEYYQAQGTDPLDGDFGPCPPTINVTIPASHVLGVKTPMGVRNPVNGGASFIYTPPNAVPKL